MQLADSPLTGGSRNRLLVGIQLVAYAYAYEHVDMLSPTGYSIVLETIISQTVFIGALLMLS